MFLYIWNRTNPCVTAGENWNASNLNG